MSEITYENLGEKLVQEIPELRPKYEEELRWWGAEKPGAHIIYGDVLDPHLMSLLDSDLNEERALNRIFVFLEQLANHEDIHVQEVLAVTVCEDLSANKERLAKARKYMGPQTLQICQEVEEWKPTKKSSVTSRQL